MKNNQIENVELESIITKMKTLLEGLNNIFELAGKRRINLMIG
jgi:hypothetical protein